MEYDHWGVSWGGNVGSGGCSRGSLGPFRWVIGGVQELDDMKSELAQLRVAKAGVLVRIKKK